MTITYKLDLSKVTPEGKALEGATFKLQKLVKSEDGKKDTYVDVPLSVTKNVFEAKGIDDGVYVLTENKAPAGYDKIDPITFEVKADHTVVWDYLSDAQAEVAFDADGAAESGRADLLTTLTGNATSGTLEFKADEQLAGLVGSVANKPTTPKTPEKPETPKEETPKTPETPKKETPETPNTPKGDTTTPTQTTKTNTVYETVTQRATTPKTGDATNMAAVWLLALLGAAALLASRIRTH